MIIPIDKGMLRCAAKNISQDIKKESLEAKAIHLISWSRRHGKAFCQLPLIELIDGSFTVVNRDFYQPAINKVVDLIKKESLKLSVAWQSRFWRNRQLIKINYPN